ncbi:NAD(P)-dependent oxidoreductase [Actinoplanes rectilineatus]|uniref:NAD(P)-dependent oxidoreductase n=1 Tax=Actinoplanes rectilineatus TaxID=113571 RepID=UPI000A8A5FB8|nr:NAD(P)H-binding protein [Actinoplanes rectilineatus]
MRIVVFGAGGRAGRRVVALAAGRGHEVTPVVRDRSRYPGSGAVEGDVTDAAAVRSLVAGHDAVIMTAVRLDVPSVTFFPAAARALVAARPRRLVAVGIGTTLEVEPGVAVHDSPGFPAEHRAFSLGHVAQLDAFRAAPADVDWVVLAPPPVVLADEPAAGDYVTGGSAVLPGTAFSYGDLAAALVDEAETPRHHRELVAVAR